MIACEDIQMEILITSIVTTSLPFPPSLHLCLHLHLHIQLHADCLHRRHLLFTVAVHTHSIDTREVGMAMIAKELEGHVLYWHGFGGEREGLAVQRPVVEAVRPLP